MENFKHFMHRGRRVVGIKPLSVKQYLRTYGPIFLWTLTTLFVIVRNAICDCVYLTVATAAPVIAVTMGVFLWTYHVKKDEVRKNYIYE